MDFVSDTLYDGTRFRVFNLIDTFNRVSLQQQARASISGIQVTQYLDQAMIEYGKPRRIRSDNGPEFAGKVLDQWCYLHGVDLYFISPGKPTENCFIESLNGKLRHECLSTNWFWSIQEAQIIIDDWRREYNEERPHGSLGGLTPCEFTRKLSKEITI